jgi:hypothetical protein
VWPVPLAQVLPRPQLIFPFQNLVFWNLFEFSLKISFNIQELLHHKSKRHETNPDAPSSSRAFQRDQECDLKHPGLVDLISTSKTKQTNYLPS